MRSVLHRRFDVNSSVQNKFGNGCLLHLCRALNLAEYCVWILRLYHCYDIERRQSPVYPVGQIRRCRFLTQANDSIRRILRIGMSNAALLFMNFDILMCVDAR